MIYITSVATNDNSEIKRVFTNKKDAKKYYNKLSEPNKNFIEFEISKYEDIKFDKYINISFDINSMCYQVLYKNYDNNTSIHDNITFSSQRNTINLLTKITDDITDTNACIKACTSLANDMRDIINKYTNSSVNLCLSTIFTRACY